MLRKTLSSALAAFVMLGALVLPATSADALTVSRAALKGGLLRLDGVNAAPGIFVTVYVLVELRRRAVRLFLFGRLSRSGGQLPRGRLPSGGLRRTYPRSPR